MKRGSTAALALVVAGAGLLAGHSVAQASTLSGDEIRDKIAGNRIFLSVPFGGEFPLFYQNSGRVDGTGEALGLGRYLQPTDSGRWWIAGDRLCQRWQSWYNGRQFCFTIRALGNNRIAWTRDDGYSGTARVGR